MPGTIAELLKIIQVPEDGLRSFLRSDVSEEGLETFFGPHALDIFKSIAQDKAASEKGDSMIIMLPGLTGSILENKGSEPETLWLNPLAFAQGHLNRLDLTADGERDAAPGVRVEAVRPMWLVYAKLVLALQFDYEVHSFSYDWRRSTRVAAAQLKDFIDEKIAAGPRKQVTLVAHSMGGLVSMDYLTGEATKSHAEKTVRRLITLGTPFRGSLEAVSSLAGGDNPAMEVARKLNTANDAARMLRTCPGVYQLLPAPNDLYQGWRPVPDVNIWDAATWTNANIPINETHLARAREHHVRLAKADPQVPVYNIAGTYYATPVELAGNDLAAAPRAARDGLNGGDGTVPAHSAVFKESPAYYVQEVHLELVLEQTVITGIKDWVEGGSPRELVQDVEKVVLNDTVLRSAAPAPPQSAVTDRVAGKITADQPLNHADIRALFMNRTG